MSEDTELPHLKELVFEMFRSRDLALHTALGAMDQRLLAMNEFRGAMEDQAALQMPRDEVQSRMNSISDKVAKSELELRDTARRHDIDTINEALSKLRDVNSAAGGRSQTISSFISVGMGILSLLIAFSSVILYSARTPVPVAVNREDLTSRLDEVNHQLQLNREVQRQIGVPK